MIAWADDVEEGVNAQQAGVLGPGLPMSEIGLSESANPCTLLARAEVKRLVSCCMFLTRVRAAFKVLKNVMMRRCFFDTYYQRSWRKSGIQCAMCLSDL
ncbi:unnamed protein product [Ectocarpus sp. CCAP 1310/34]|nr:unnamed protein product [Ectocarpus sp. CCAP 1310/34]